MPTQRKIVYLSGSRADFGLMQSTLLLINNDPRFELSIAVTGMHLDPVYGDTVKDIEATGLKIAARIPCDVQSRSEAGMALSFGQTITGLVQLFSAKKPDILVLLGDRGEMLAGAVAAMHFGIIIVHIHGGERSGTIDESIRHAISKISHYHLTSTHDAKIRLERMGEIPEHIYVSGAPGLDGIVQLSATITRSKLSTQTGLPEDVQFVLCLFHPVVQQANDAFVQTLALRSALLQIGLPVLWMSSNSDAGADEILRAVLLQPLPSGSVNIAHLSRAAFCAAMRLCAVMVGNSSAGIIEAACFNTRVINIGRRQHARIRSSNVVDVEVNQVEISSAINAALAYGKQQFENCYYSGNAGEKIANYLALLSLDKKVLEKSNAY